MLLLGVPLTFAAIWDMRAIALATYSYLPSSADLRGPGAMLRVFAIVILAMPVLLAVGPALALTRSIGLAFLLGILVTLIEGWLLVALAAWRLRGNALVFARAESR